MPKSERRRAPKRSKQEETTPDVDIQENKDDWIESSDLNTPFGLVQPEMQAYFKEMNVHLTKLKHSEDTEASAEEAQMLIQAALTEMDGNELVLATDPTCSLVLENMAGVMGIKALRVFFDRMAGSYFTLAEHRFGSHVLQSMLSAAQAAMNEDYSTKEEETDPEQGVLRTLPQLIKAMFLELELSFEEMLSNQFASHVLRSLIALLAGVPISSFDDLRSKRSAKYRSKEHQRDMMVDTGAKTDAPQDFVVPPLFLRMLYQLYDDMHSILQPKKICAIIPDRIAAPTLSVILKLENGLTDGKQSKAWARDSITARVLEYTDNGSERSDIMESALRDTIATHVLQSALLGARNTALARFWKVYIRGRVVKLGAHPCANFVVATLLRLLPITSNDEGPFAEALSELEQAGDQLVKNSMLGTLQTAVERCAEANALEDKVMRAVLAAFRFPLEGEIPLFVPVVLSMHTLKAFKNLAKSADEKEVPGKRKRAQNEDERVTTQGSILLQRVSLLHPPHQQYLYDSLAKNKALYSCRVADALWNAADGFTKGKIVELALKHEKRLIASTYGRFFIQRLHLGVYRKSREEWREWAVTQSVPTETGRPNDTVNPFAFLRVRQLETTSTTRKKRSMDGQSAELDTIFAAIE
ncbi:Nop9p [Malassezia vespertilionis]|uniref:Nucleolar protein 9 n=1 Tax=Malassezia vespertilionis TaxID=2020962 RepID=A0A2N1JGE8_9BASI|nr:Nop9p [Malassezia vespertilionis]